MTQDHSSQSESTGIWYTYFGKGGASVIGFLWIVAAIAWIIYVLNFG